jgi:PhnB protein
MAIRNLNAYMTFNGTAGKAIALYERVLGAQKVNITQAGDVPGMNAPPDRRDRIVHGVLMLGGTQVMVSDAPSAVSTPADVQVSLDFTDLGEMEQKFAALAEGGAVTVPLQDTFWGAKFGMLTDPFGVRWMFNCAVPKSDQQHEPGK